MAKRIRGWQLEKAGVARPPKKKLLQPWKRMKTYDTKQSSLACKLLSLWAHGLLSATMIREIASCALDDGAQHEELVHLAEAGSWGQQPGNIHRSILRRFCKDVGLEKPISVSVPCIDNKTTLEKVEQAQIYLPHLVFAGLAENYPSFFEDSMSLKHLEKFWLQVEKSVTSYWATL